MVPDRKFIEAVASAAPTPGGGGASAYAGALAAALGSMVGNLTLGKQQYAAVQDDLKGVLSQLKACREELLHLVEDDAKVFSALARTWKMPKGTPMQRQLRHDAGQKALLGACEVPLQIMRICAKVIELDDFMAHNASRLALSDVGASVALAKGAMEAAALNVYVNTAMMDDLQTAEAFEREAKDLVKSFSYQADVLYDYVRHEVSGK